LAHVQRSVFTKAGIERAIHTTCNGLQTISDCVLLSMDMETSSTPFSAGVSLRSCTRTMTTCILLSRWLG
jgi:hypothetical protein